MKLNAGLAWAWKENQSSSPRKSSFAAVGLVDGVMAVAVASVSPWSSVPTSFRVHW